MSCLKKRNFVIVILSVFIFLMAVLPMRAFGDVKPIEELEDKLEGISEEEKVVLEELFRLQQEIDGLVAEETKVTHELESLQRQIEELGEEIKQKQVNYRQQLNVLEQVLVNYQRRGPASYIELLLKSNNLSEFLMSLNIMKDISHNVEELLVGLESSRLELEEEKLLLSEKTTQIEEKQAELLLTLEAKEEVQTKQETNLASLHKDREFYQEQLSNISQMWSDCQLIFSDVVKELNRIIGSGYYTEEDLNLTYGFFTVQGYLQGENFNRILKENSNMTDTIFLFEEEKVIIRVPEKHLELQGYFEIAGESAISYVVTEGTFYDLPLEAASMEELFRNGPLLIDFNGITGDMVMSFKINEVWSEEGTLNFVIIPQF